MNPICRVRTEQSRQLDQEVYWSLFFYRKGAKRRLVISYILLGLLIILFLRDLSLLFVYHSLPYICMTIVYAVMLAIASYRLIFQGRIYGRAREKERKKLVGDRTVYSEMFFYEGEFCFCSAVSNAKHSAPYRDVDKVEETDHYYVIFLHNNQAFIFSKTGLVEGNLQQALFLLMSRGNVF